MTEGPIGTPLSECLAPNGCFITRPQLPQSAQQAKRKADDACQAAKLESGRIAYVGVSGTVAEVFGATGGFGRFTNLQTGTSGHYAIAGTAVGQEMAATGGGGIATSIGAFLGLSLNVSGALGSVSGTFSVNSGGSSQSLSSAWGEGATATLSYTGIFGCKLGR